MSRREQVFSGWGEPGAGPGFHAEALLRSELGVSGEVVAPPVSLDAVRLTAPALSQRARERLAAVAELRDDREIRVLRCRGKSYLDLLAQRAGDCASAPDAVVTPDADGVAEVLRICAEEEVAVVPFGGGTSVVGGLAGERGRFGALISLDLGRLDGVLGVDRESRVAVLQPGLRLPEADRALRAHGLALGHVPQSYEWASVGGCAATRSSGQASTGFGRLDEQVVAVELVTPAGSLATLDAPASAAGPSLRELALGSEGTLGVLARVALRVRPYVEGSYEGWSFGSFAAGADALRGLEQDGLAPDIARLSDEEETRISLALAGAGLAGRVLLGGRCLLICGWEGGGRRRAAQTRLLRAGGRPLGPSPGRAWARSRFAGPHVRDGLMDRGVMVETFETATTWSNLMALHAAVRAALPAVHVGGHVSHVYPTGASLYYTVLAAQDADPAAQWRALKATVTEAILTAGGTLTHHHAVGTEHAPWLAREVGAFGVDVLRALKERCDPAGIMNPGKLLPSPSTSGDPR